VDLPKAVRGSIRAHDAPEPATLDLAIRAANLCVRGSRQIQLLPWWPDEGEGLLVYVGMLLVWAQALYVLTRGKGLIPNIAALAMFAFAAYLMGLWAGAQAFPDAPARWVGWLRGTFWGSVLAAAFWLLLAIALFRQEGPPALQPQLRRLFPIVGVVWLGTAATFAVLAAAGQTTAQVG